MEQSKWEGKPMSEEDIKALEQDWKLLEEAIQYVMKHGENM